jgi:hypothetical protein
MLKCNYHKKYISLEGNTMQIISLSNRVNGAGDMLGFEIIFRDRHNDCLPVFVNKDSREFSVIESAVADYMETEDLDTFTLAVGRQLDVFATLEQTFSDAEGCSSKISVQNGNVYINGEVVEPFLGAQILKMQRQGVEIWGAFGKFIDNLYDNTSREVRNQLYRWLLSEFTRTGQLTLTDDGCFIGYKGFERVDSDEVPANERRVQSVHQGRAYVNGVIQFGKIMQQAGDEVTMYRGDVQDDPNIGCSHGLHVGTWDYACSWAPAVYSVKVNPSNVVSVPTECDAQKIRCCAYELIEPMTEAYEFTLHGFNISPTAEQRAELDADRERRIAAFRALNETDEDDYECDRFDDEICEECGEHYDDCECGMNQYCRKCQERLEDCCCDEDDDYNDEDEGGNCTCPECLDNELEKLLNNDFDNSPAYLRNSLNKAINRGFSYSLQDAGVDVKDTDYLRALLIRLDETM